MATFRQPPERPARPRALIVTIYGLYARDSGGWLSVAALIRLMAGLGADEPAVRSAVSRLKRRGILQPRREGGAAGYGLSEAGRQALAEGDRRIFGRPRARLSDGWLLAVFSVPEPERSQRHALRTRLTWLGFGTVAAGVWIAPGHLAAETTEVLERAGLAGYVALFRADYLAFGDVGGQLGRWWDLGRLERMYQEFTDAYAPMLHRWESGPAPDPGADIAAGAGTSAGAGAGTGTGTGTGVGTSTGVGVGTSTGVGSGAGTEAGSGPGTGAGTDAGAGGGTGAGSGVSDAAAFADYVTALTDWRRLPFLDPGLPAELLPARWPGTQAADLFGKLRARLDTPARRHARSVTRPTG